MRCHKLLLLFLAMGWISLGSLGAAKAGTPSDVEQLWLQLINRFRADPAGELDRLVNYRQPGTGTELADPIADSPAVALAIEFFDVDPAELRRQFQSLQPAPPLAWNEQLHDSARYYSNVMIQQDEQSHELDQYKGPTGLLDRLRREGGYDFAGGGTAGENLFAYAEDVLSGHAGFILDWGNSPTGIQIPPGHRDSLLNPIFQEIGIAAIVENDPSTDVGPLVTTQHLAADFSNGPVMAGVIYEDADDDEFYSPGEGLGNLAIELRPESGEVALAQATTYASGGFRLDLTEATPGLYRVVVKDPDPVYWSEPIDLTDRSQNLAAELIDPQYDIDSLSRVLREGRSWSRYDLNRDGEFNSRDRTYLIEEVRGTYLGDSNLDGEFDSADLVVAFQAGQYEDDVALNSVWETGDWDGDGEFLTSDVVAAFQGGGYNAGPRPAVARSVPEPSSWLAALIGSACGMWFRNAVRGRRATWSC